MYDKPKIKKIRRLPDGDKILLFWVMLLATAGKCNAGGLIFITEKVPFSEEDLAEEFKFEINTIRLALKTFVRFDMISIYDDGFISICGWEEHQNVDRLAELREYNRIAKQKSRAKQKQLSDVNDKSMTSQSCQDIEEEREEDKEKEKEIHSFTLSDEEREEEMSKRRRIFGSVEKGLVMLSDDQMEDLLSRLTLEEFDKYFDIVAECERNGKSFKKKTHYQAILDMAEADRKVHRRKQ